MWLVSLFHLLCSIIRFTTIVLFPPPPPYLLHKVCIACFFLFIFFVLIIWQSSFSVIGLRIYRFYRFYRIMRVLKKSKLLPPLGSEPRHLWLSSPVRYPWPILPVCWKSQLFRSLCSLTLSIPTRLPANRGISSGVACRTWKSGLPGFTSQWM